MQTEAWLFASNSSLSFKIKLMNNNYNDQVSSRDTNTNFDSYYHQPLSQQEQLQRTQIHIQPDSTIPELQLNPNSNQLISPPQTRNNSGGFHPLLLQTPIVLHPGLPNHQAKIFSQEEFNTLQALLPAAETHKWKFISNKVSKLRAKKMNSEFCSAKFHDFFDLPQNKSSNETNVQYLNNDKSFYDSGSRDNREGQLGSSLPYMVHPNPY